ncbi:MAG TPA: transposase [Candidatus Didemnitutus sp.]|nr:transposase [Candidatus Didemnitutus sp.]
MGWKQTKGHAALRRGRWSCPGAEYFLTICISQRQSCLIGECARKDIFNSMHALEGQGIWHLRAATLMPDHAHLLIVLNNETPLSSAVRLFKGRSAPTLRTCDSRWQRGYFDHRIRGDEDRLPVFLYLFLNPYQAGLIPTHERWPGFYCSPEDWSWFEPLTNMARPQPEWLP